jgi:hypothetical protein
MFDAGTITFQEFAMAESLPLATIQNAVLEFLRDRDDAVVFGAQAVNAYVGEARMTQVIDLMLPRAAELAEELCEYLHHEFQIAVRVRAVVGGRGYRVYQVQKSGNRHLVYLQAVDKLPPAQRIGQVLVMSPPQLIASKVVGYAARRGKPKSGTDWRDIAMLLLTFPEFKNETGVVKEQLQEAGADESVLAVWQELVEQDIEAEEDDEEF